MSNNRPRKGGQIIPLFALMVVLIFGFAGFGFDVVYAYVVDAILSNAVDATALIAVRSLPQGSTAVNAVVDETFDANFPDGFMNTISRSHSIPLIVDNGDGTQSVSITGTARLPTFFMGMFGYRHIDVAAIATGVRRDVNLMLILDRSGSMVLAPPDSQGRTPFQALQDSSKIFVDKFDENRDRVGVVSFGTNARVDLAPLGNFKASVKAKIDSLTSFASNHTNSPLALWEVYNALSLLNDPGPLNVVVYFTDGQSTAIPGQFTVNTSGSPSCPTSPREGAYMTGQSGGAVSGLFQLLAPPAPTANPDYEIITGCSGLASNGSNGEDLIISPFLDDWYPLGIGNPPAISIYGINAINPAAITNGNTVIAIGDNMLVNVAGAARLDPNIDVSIFAIGLGGYLGPAKHDILQRVANTGPFADPAAGPVGLYVYAPGPDDLEDAFLDVASEITRLAQ